MKTILNILLLVFILVKLHGQESVSASGGNATGSGGSASYTVGQVVFTALSGTDGSVSQGVQQSYEIMVVSEIEEAGNIGLTVTSYPNPVSDRLNLKIENNDLNNLTYCILDLKGSIIVTNRITEKETEIFTGDFVPAIYFLKVFNESIEIKSFKIIKN